VENCRLLFGRWIEPHTRPFIQNHINPSRKFLETAVLTLGWRFCRDQVPREARGRDCENLGSKIRKTSDF